MSTDCDSLVVGGGVVGIAVARALALAGDDVVLVEAERHPVQHTSSRNSEVIHAGLYYTPGSNKALLCTAGRERTYAYLRERGLPHRQCGKLVVATADGELERLADVERTARINGVPGLQWLDAAALARRAPGIAGVAALEVPVTGILDSHAFAMSLLADAESAGCAAAWGQRVIGIEPGAEGPLVTLADAADGERDRVACRRLVNCAGHGAVALYHACAGYGARRPLNAAWARGDYAAVSGPAPVPELIYPVPRAHGLGVHVTFDLAGHVRLGPDVAWTDRADDLDVDPAYPERARAAAARYWPAVAERSVHADYAGVRPKLRLEDEILRDFVFETDRDDDDGEWRVVHCLGIESPGLTSALAIADRVVEGGPFVAV